MKIEKMEMPIIKYSSKLNQQWEKPLFQQLTLQLKQYKSWENIFANKEWFNKYNIHLGVFIEPYLDLILKGKKTIESRFSINRCPPFQKALKDDIILLKRSGGPIVGVCQIAHVWSYTLDLQLWNEIKLVHSVALCIQDEKFWEQKQKSKFATLMKITNVTLLDVPIIITKKDKRGWVVLCDKTLSTVFSPKN